MNAILAPDGSAVKVAREEIIDIVELVDCIVLACEALEPNFQNPIKRVASIASDRLTILLDTLDVIYTEMEKGAN